MTWEEPDRKSAVSGPENVSTKLVHQCPSAVLHAELTTKSVTSPPTCLRNAAQLAGRASRCRGIGTAQSIGIPVGNVSTSRKGTIDDGGAAGARRDTGWMGLKTSILSLRSWDVDKTAIRGLMNRSTRTQASLRRNA
jgi:hypothetical protein